MIVCHTTAGIDKSISSMVCVMPELFCLFPSAYTVCISSGPASWSWCRIPKLQPCPGELSYLLTHAHTLLILCPSFVLTVFVCVQSLSFCHAYMTLVLHSDLNSIFIRYILLLFCCCSGQFSPQGSTKFHIVFPSPCLIQSSTR